MPWAASLFICFAPMSSNRNWNVLSWNMRGPNSSYKWDAIRSKIDESACSVFCLQETKRAIFDSPFLHKFAPRHFNKFCFVPAFGALGGLITAWNGSLFEGSVIHSNRFSLTVKLSSTLTDQIWFITNVYGPCTPGGKAEF